MEQMTHEELAKKKIGNALLFNGIMLFVIIVLGLFAEFSIERIYIPQVKANFDNFKESAKNDIEQTYRQLARNQLKQMQFCISTLMNDTSYKMQMPFDDKLFFVMDTCSKKARQTLTGDVFSFRLTDYMFVYDPSLDCLPSNNTGKKFLDSKESMEIMKKIQAGDTSLEYPECYLHKIPSHCFTARTELTRGYDSRHGDNVYWDFDDSPEWLEWIVLPVEDYGYDAVPRGHEKQKPLQYVLAIGTQADEAFTTFQNSIKAMEMTETQVSNTTAIKTFIRLLLFINIAFCLISAHLDIKKLKEYAEERCNSCLIRRRRKDEYE